MKKYEVIKAQYVIQKLGLGTDVLVCDFKFMQISDCMDLTIRAINSYLEREDVVFYTVTETEESA